MKKKNLKMNIMKEVCRVYRNDHVESDLHLISSQQMFRTHVAYGLKHNYG